MHDYQLFTSESVSEGHPDKMADQISDALLDAILREDLHAQVACETLVKTERLCWRGKFRPMPILTLNVLCEIPLIVLVITIGLGL